MGRDHEVLGTVHRGCSGSGPVNPGPASIQADVGHQVVAAMASRSMDGDDDVVLRPAHGASMAVVTEVAVGNLFEATAAVN